LVDQDVRWSDSGTLRTFQIRVRSGASRSSRSAGAVLEPVDPATDERTLCGPGIGPGSGRGGRTRQRPKAAGRELTPASSIVVTNVAEQVRMHPRDPDSCRVGQLLQPAGGRVPIQPRAVCVAQGRPAIAAVDGAVDGSTNGPTALPPPSVTWCCGIDPPTRSSWTARNLTEPGPSQASRTSHPTTGQGAVRRPGAAFHLPAVAPAVALLTPAG
jgi:hypothetical protein